MNMRLPDNIQDDALTPGFAADLLRRERIGLYWDMQPQDDHAAAEFRVRVRRYNKKGKMLDEAEHRCPLADCESSRYECIRPALERMLTRLRALPE